MTKKELEEKVANLETSIMCLSCKDFLNNEEHMELNSMEQKLSKYQKDLEDGNYELWEVLSKLRHWLCQEWGTLASIKR